MRLSRERESSKRGAGRTGNHFKGTFSWCEGREGDIDHCLKARSAGGSSKRGT